MSVYSVTFLLHLFQRNTKDSNILHFLRDGVFKRSLPVEGTLEQVHGLTFHTDLQGKQSLWTTDVGNGGSSTLNLLLKVHSGHGNNLVLEKNYC